MHRISSLLTIACILFSFTPCFSQYDTRSYHIEPGTTSLDIPGDAQSIIMGGALCSVTNENSSVFYNPAILGTMHGLHFSYGANEGGLYLIDNITHSAELAIKTSGPTLYTFFRGQDKGFFSDGDEPYISQFNYTFGIGTGVRLNDNLSLGMTLKLFNEVGQRHGIAEFTYIQTITRPVFLDFGVVYSVKNIFVGKLYNDEFSAGASLQNIGSQYLHFSTYSIIGEGAIFRAIPTSYNIGCSYTFIAPATNPGDLTPFTILITAQNHSYLNTEYSTSNYVGMGSSLTIYEYVTFFGGFQQSLHSNQHPHNVNGLGIVFNLPLNHLHITKNPAVIKLKIGAIVTPQVSDATVSLEYVYVNDIF